MSPTLFPRSIAVIGLVGFSLFGLVTASTAATLTSATVTSSSEIGITGKNATPITVAATSVTGAPANMFNINLPAGWSFVTPGPSCAGITLTGFVGTPTCQLINFSATSGFATIQMPSGTFTANQALSVTFAENTINVAGAREFTIDFADSITAGTVIDTGTAILAGGTPAPEPEPAPAPEPSSDTSTATLATTGTAGELIIVLATLALSLGGALLFGARQRARSDLSARK